MTENKMKSLYEISSAIIEKINARKNPFDTVTLVFHSAKIAQWFKAYYIKTQENILMNVRFETLSSFINETINPGNAKHILTVGEYREYLIKALLDTNLPGIDYYRSGGKVNGIHLYEFADKLSTVIFNMEFDNEELTNGWQKDIYQKANEYAEKDGCYTPGQMYLKNQSKLHKPKGKVYVFNNSYITALYREILEKIGADISVFSLDDKEVLEDKKIELYAAPSKMREVERLHSDICKKLEDEKNFARVNDFVVYAPNINDYANLIHRVFQKNAPGFPEVPFRIIGESKEKHDMLTALDLLYKIADKGFFTRYDLWKYLKNPMVMFVKEISDEDVSAFMKAVEETNTHRGGNGNEDWDYFKKRLLVSLLSEDVTVLKDGSSLAYSAIEMDTGRINKLIDIIDDLSAWAGEFGDDLSSKMLNKDEIGKILPMLNALFSNENKYGEEKNYLYADVRKEAEKIQKIFETIPATTFLLLLKDAPNRFSTNPADVFAGGVTFLSLDIDNIVSEKYVYVLGMSSNNFPRVENKNEIDYSQNHQYTYELDKKAFGNLLKSSENVIISFQNRDLQTDEEFFPSTVIPAKERENYKANGGQSVIPLDESRDLSELYTYRGILNRMRIENMGEENRRPASPSKNGDKNIPKITTNRIRKYLENTIVYKYSQTVKDSDTKEQARSEEYEIIDVPALSQYGIIKEMILTGKKIADEGTEPTEEEMKKKLFDRMNLQNRLPKNLEEDYFKIFCSKAKDTINIIKDGYKKTENFAVDMLTDGNEKWVLEMNTLCFMKEEGNRLNVIEPVELKDRPKQYLGIYAAALAYVASIQDPDAREDKEYKVNLISQNTRTFTATVGKAREILNEIYKAMCDFDSIRYMDIDLLTDIQKEIGDRDSKTVNIADLKKLPYSVEDLLKKIEKHGSWAYFNDKQMLDPETDFGYDASKGSIKSDIWDAYCELKDFILY